MINYTITDGEIKRHSCTLGDCIEHTILEAVGSKYCEHRKGADKKDLYTSRIDGKKAIVEIKSNSGRIDTKKGNKYIIYAMCLPTDVVIIDNRVIGLKPYLFTVPCKDFLQFLQENGLCTPVTGGVRIATLYDKKGNDYQWRRKAVLLTDWLEENDLGTEWLDL